MPENCFACEYKRLAREILADLSTTASLLGMVDDWCGNHYAAWVTTHKKRFAEICERQRRDKEGNPPSTEGLPAGQIVAVEVLRRSVAARNG